MPRAALIHSLSPMPAQAQPFAFTPSGTDFYTLTRLYMCLYMCTLKSVYITYMFLYHRSIMIPAALVFMLLTVTTRSAPCSTLQSCVDDATAANSTLNVILPPVLRASTANCNVSIIGNSNFNRAVVSGSGSSRTIIDCTASGLCLLPRRSAHSCRLLIVLCICRFALSHCCKHLAPAT
jgi:hypothetical protein